MPHNNNAAYRHRCRLLLFLLRPVRAGVVTTTTTTWLLLLLLLLLQLQLQLLSIKMVQAWLTSAPIIRIPAAGRLQHQYPFQFHHHHHHHCNGFAFASSAHSPHRRHHRRHYQPVVTGYFSSSSSDATVSEPTTTTMNDAVANYNYNNNNTNNNNHDAATAAATAAAATTAAGQYDYTVPPDAVVHIKPAAMRRLRELKVQQQQQQQKKSSDDEYMTLRMGVKSGGCSGMSYVMDFCSADSIHREDDQVDVYEKDKIQCVVDAKSMLYLFGLELDYSTELIGGGFKFSNPNAEESCGCGSSFSV